MHNYIEQLTELFLQFPGIGRRQAQRFVYTLLHKNPSYVQQLTDSIHKLKESVNQCSQCFRFYQKNGNAICDICSHADKTKLLIVEKDADLENLHKTKVYDGSYFVLGGFISSHDKRKSFVRTDELIERIKRDVDAGMLTEVIFGLSVSPEAEHTRLRLLSMIRDSFPSLTFSTLGRGLSTGTELEYSDTETLKYALQSRIAES